MLTLEREIDLPIVCLDGFLYFLYVTLFHSYQFFNEAFFLYHFLEEVVMNIISVEDTKVQMTELVLPSHSNNHGTAFGGQIAAWCDIAAAISAQRFCRSPVVTVSMDQLHFLEPVRKGMVVILQAKVNQDEFIDGNWCTSCC